MSINNTVANTLVSGAEAARNLALRAESKLIEKGLLPEDRNERVQRLATITQIAGAACAVFAAAIIAAGAGGAGALVAAAGAALLAVVGYDLWQVGTNVRSASENPIMQLVSDGIQSISEGMGAFLGGQQAGQVRHAMTAALYTQNTIMFRHIVNWTQENIQH